MTTALDDAFEVADALGADFTALQPPGEQRFEPGTVAVLAATWILKAVGDGVAEGIREVAKQGTVEILIGITSAVKRWVRQYVPRAFSEGPTRARLEAAAAEADASLAALHHAKHELGAQLAAELPEAVGVAVREALCAEGLSDAAAVRVELALAGQIRARLTRVKI